MHIVIKMELKRGYESKFFIVNNCVDINKWITLDTQEYHIEVKLIYIENLQSYGCYISKQSNRTLKIKHYTIFKDDYITPLQAANNSLSVIDGRSDNYSILIQALQLLYNFIIVELNKHIQTRPLVNIICNYFL